MGKYDSKKPRTRKKVDELEKTYRGLYSAPKRKRNTKQESAARRKTIIIVFSCVLALSLIILVACLFLFNDRGTVIVEGVSVAGVDVGGMTKEKAIEAVNAAVKNTYTKKEMSVTVVDTTVTIPREAVSALDVEAAVETALKYGNTGTKKQQQAERNEAKLNGYIVDLTPYIKPDSALITEKVAELGAVFNRKIHNHTYEVRGDRPTDADIQAGINLQTLVVTLSTPEFGLNTDALYAQIIDAYNANQFTVTGHCSLIEPEPLDLQAILDEYGVAPVNAELKPGTDSPTPGKYGYGFDLVKARELLENAEPGSTVEIPFLRLEPEITTDSLSGDLYKDVLATWTTKEEDSSEDRNTNLRLACKAIDGYTLNPGEAFSYNNVLGERTAARGYKPGPSYVGGKDELTIGGGICQVSTTLYYCTIVADLNIVERESHGYLPAYANPGEDAMVSWGSYDFRFTNSTKYPIKIVATANAGSVTVSILGTIGDSDLKDHIIRIERKTISEDPCVTTYEAPPAGNPDGYKNGDYMVTPHKGYEVETYRRVYDKNGALISEKKINDSFYKRRDGVICEIPEENDTQDPDTGNQGIGGSGGITISPSGSI